MSLYKLPRAEEWFEHAVDTKLFPPFAILFLAALAVALFRAMPGGILGSFSRDVAVHHKAFATFGPIAGAMFGWISIMCAQRLAKSGVRSLPEIGLVLLHAFYLIGVPVILYFATSKLVAGYSQPSTRIKRYPQLLRLLAVVQLGITVFYLHRWLNEA